MNRPVHFEIHASDPAKLSEFYVNVFGWTVNHLPQMDYWLLNTGGEAMGINGGMLKRASAKPSGGSSANAFVCSLGVASVDEMLKKALAAGATMAMPKQAIPGIGYQAYIHDPDGNLVGLHQPDPGAK